MTALKNYSTKEIKIVYSIHKAGNLFTKGWAKHSNKWIIYKSTFKDRLWIENQTDIVYSSKNRTKVERKFRNL
jgi:hypothetical protein